MSCIYGLINDDTGELRYVGKTRDINERFKEHLYSSKKIENCKLPVHKWIYSLINKDIKVNYIVIEESDDYSKLNDLEIFYISYFKYLGCRLLNLTNGGKGMLGYKYDVETCIKNSQRQGGKYFIDNFGEIYYSPRVAAKKLGITDTCIRDVLKNGVRKVAKEYSFAHIDENTDIESLTKELQKRVDLYGEKLDRKVLSVDGNIFENINEASNFYNINKIPIIKCCLEVLHKTKNKTFCYIKKDDNIEEKINILKYRLNYRDSKEFKEKQSIQRGGKPFKDNNGNIYISIAEASKILNIHRAGIRRVLQGKQEKCKNYSFHYAIH